MSAILHRLFLPFIGIAWAAGYLAVGMAWLIAWYPVWVFTGKNILKDPNPPFRWMDKAP